MGGKLGSPWERFQTKYQVDQATGCWEWSVGKSDKGYGTFFFPPQNMIGAHIAAWKLYRGSTNGLFVLHSCDNPGCVNPDHLRLGTQKENMEDRDSRGRRAPPKGSKNGRATLTEKQVLAIRKDGRWPRFIAADYGVPVSTIQKIRFRETWKHI